MTPFLFSAGRVCRCHQQQSIRPPRHWPQTRRFHKDSNLSVDRLRHSHRFKCHQWPPDCIRIDLSQQETPRTPTSFTIRNSRRPAIRPSSTHHLCPHEKPADHTVISTLRAASLGVQASAKSRKTQSDEWLRRAGCDAQAAFLEPRSTPWRLIGSGR